MSVGATGSLASVKRTDYLPFGEELSAGVGIRSSAYGYAADCWRQKFTGYERDVETGLDYAQARMYGNVQGRFMGVDPMLSSGQIGSPQSWNRYTYGANNPLRYVDPLGLYSWSASLGGNRSDQDILNEIGNLSEQLNEANIAHIGELQAYLDGRQTFRNAIAELSVASGNESLSQDQRADISRAITAYGAEGDVNGVSVGIGALREGIGAQADPTGYMFNKDGDVVAAKVEVTIGRHVSGQELVMAVAHEGSHVADRQEAVTVWAATGNYNQARNAATNITKYATENRAYHVSASIAAHQNRDNLTMGAGFTIWTRGMQNVDQQVLNGLIQRHYSVTPDDQGPRLLP